GVQTCALPIWAEGRASSGRPGGGGPSVATAPLDSSELCCGVFGVASEVNVVFRVPSAGNSGHSAAVIGGIPSSRLSFITLAYIVGLRHRSLLPIVKGPVR